MADLPMESSFPQPFLDREGGTCFTGSGGRLISSS